MSNANIFLLVLICLLAHTTAQAIQKPLWTAYFLRNTTCDPSLTGHYNYLSLATDSQGRVWQFSGSPGSCPDRSFLRHFDRTTQVWTTAWVPEDSGPAARSDYVMRIDKDDNLFIYGGRKEGVPGNLNEFWKYSIADNVWTELTVGDGSRNFVQKGQEDAANYPGPRRGSGYWYTPDDNSLWLFGGLDNQYDTQFGPGLPDLWRFNINTERWSFVAGLSEQVTDTTVFNGSMEVTPRQRWAALCAVDKDYNLWLFGGEIFSNDLWMFNRSSGWQHINGNVGFSCTGSYSPLVGEFSSSHRPECSAYSSMTYVGNNMLALWSSFDYLEEGPISLWLYKISSQEWMKFEYNRNQSVNVLSVPDESTSPGFTYFTRVNAHGTVWVVSDMSYGVFSMDLQCWGVVNPCSTDATCTPNLTQMNPTCECKEGFVGDGFTCQLAVAVPLSSSTPSSNNVPTSNNTSSATHFSALIGLALVAAFMMFGTV